MRCLRDHHIVESDRTPHDTLKYDNLKIDGKWFVEKKECSNQNDGHSHGGITCMLA